MKHKTAIILIVLMAISCVCSTIDLFTKYDLNKRITALENRSEVTAQADTGTQVLSGVYRVGTDLEPGVYNITASGSKDGAFMVFKSYEKYVKDETEVTDVIDYVIVRSYDKDGAIAQDNEKHGYNLIDGTVLVIEGELNVNERK